MINKMKFWLLFAVGICVLLMAVPINSVSGYMLYGITSQKNLYLSYTLVDPNIRFISADSANKVALQAKVRDANGNPVPMVKLRFAVAQDLGNVSQDTSVTNKAGECIVEYHPPEYNKKNFKNIIDKKVTLSAQIVKTKKAAVASITLKTVPVVFVHGYKAYPDNFDNMKQYLHLKNIEGVGLKYKSEAGVAAAAKELEQFLKARKKEDAAAGLYTSRYDLICHSMGGLVARYFTVSQSFVLEESVRKLIFISVPHKGSPLALLGMNYYNDQAIGNLAPDSPLFTQQFPSMLNKGLHPLIPVYNIAAQYDEVVNFESSSLEEWGIDTHVFNVGENKLTMDNILNGQIFETANHKAILSNKRVFENIETALIDPLPQPHIKK